MHTHTSTSAYTLTNTDKLTHKCDDVLAHIHTHTHATDADTQKDTQIKNTHSPAHTHTNTHTDTYRYGNTQMHVCTFT